MRIGIDARMYGPKIGGAGVGRYVEEMILALQQADDEHEYVVFLRKKNFANCPTPNKRWTKVVADIPWYGLREQLWMPGIFAAKTERSTSLQRTHPDGDSRRYGARPDNAGSFGRAERQHAAASLRTQTTRPTFYPHRIARDARAVVTVSEHAKTKSSTPHLADKVHVK